MSEAEVAVDFGSFVDLIDEFVGLFQGEEEIEKMERISEIQDSLKKNYNMKIQESDMMIRGMDELYFLILIYKNSNFDETNIKKWRKL